MRITNSDATQNNLNLNLNDNNDLENLKRLSTQGKNKPSVVDKEKKLKEADSVAKEFETLFVDMMMKSMRETAKPEEETNAENIYKGMLDSEYSKTMTDAQSFGIREMVRQWIVDNS
ncbi:MAG: rod-binding protein [Bdellovibrionota bacterium]